MGCPPHARAAYGSIANAPTAPRTVSPPWAIARAEISPLFPEMALFSRDGHLVMALCKARQMSATGACARKGRAKARRGYSQIARPCPLSSNPAAEPTSPKLYSITASARAGSVGGTRNGSAAEISARAPSRERPSKTASKSPLSADATHDANALASKAPPAPKTSAAATH
jgi:hypothetical protein